MGIRAAQKFSYNNLSIKSIADQFRLSINFINNSQAANLIQLCVLQGDIMIIEKRKTKFTLVLQNGLLPKTKETILKKARCK